ncbi:MULTISPECIES: CaiB/BaiF CoA transferase family protein [Achromobacter]|uniref:CoA transferase n=1 Tax=Achromobacter spanius TaxID=217203 RepID=A0ABY8GLK8_9BURK|nr:MULTISPECIES: CoA transferase [Achromobacter]WAI85106.1 CoA transferase [Achromobacter spanius]WEX95188.1 CoA transferase [Achromobacter sp. SS2-2022]WFP05642.1 CoA transferase [Achromobacter spanius]
MDALQGLRVVDFSKVLAGPLCTQYLGDMGAEVIKVEPLQGDDTRRWPPFRQEDGTVFLSVNRNKRSVALDLKSAQGREAAQRLIATADIVVESFGPGVATRLGIDYASAAALRPDVVYCSISGFGSKGPLNRGKGYDVILQAFSGMMSITGEQGGPAIRSPISPIDQATGMHAATGILAAVVRRLRTGKGCKVEASLFDTSVGFMSYVMQSYWERGTEPCRWGSAHESLCPYQVFQANDRPLLLGVANDTLWRTFCNEAGQPELADDPRYATNADRVGHRPEVLERVAAIMGEDSRDGWIERLSRAGIPCAPIQGVGEVLTHDHMAASDMIYRFEESAHGELNVVSQPLRFDGQRPIPSSPPPTVGQHTRQVLTELGYDEAAIAHYLQARQPKVAAGEAD